VWTYNFMTSVSTLRFGELYTISTTSWRTTGSVGSGKKQAATREGDLSFYELENSDMGDDEEL